MKTSFFAALGLSVVAGVHAHKGGHHKHAAYVARRDAVLANRASKPAPLAARDGFVLPPLESINKDMAPQPTQPLFTTFAAGATATAIPGAPALPMITGFTAASGYPPEDHVPPTDSPEVKEWLKVLDGVTIPPIALTVIGATGDPCVDNPAAQKLASASDNCWWTCGGCLRDTDIATCPNKLTWGVSYDDGPSEYTPTLLNHLHDQNLQATFFVLGSRVLDHPLTLQAEHLLGHELSVHTWSHTSLTTLTNEQIVAELGWTKKIIHDTVGVTPNTFRAPYGDLDDRVRAVAKAMNLVPIQWTGHDEDEFDTDDWKIPGGASNGTSSLAEFTKLLGLANNLNTGFIVLEHDLFQQEVDMSIGYFLPLAASHQPALKLEAVFQCLGEPLGNSYVETFNGAAGGGTNTTASASSGASASASATGSATATGSGTKAAATGTATASVTKSVGSASKTGAATATSAAASGTQSSAPNGAMKLSSGALGSIGVVALGVLLLA